MRYAEAGMLGGVPMLACAGGGGAPMMMMGGCAPQMMGSGSLMDLDDVGCATFGDDESDCEGFAAAPTISKGVAKKRGVGGAPRRGVANAARVSRGSEFDVWSGLTVREPERHRSEHVTITVVLYNTVAGGVPTEEDVQAAVDDLEQLYASCAADGRLGDSTFDFMKEELTVKDAVDITTKVKTQPYAPPPVAVTGASTFPVDGA